MKKRILEKHERWMGDKEYAQAYASLEDEFALAETLIQARIEAHMTQTDVARAMGISQPAIVRIESGKNLSLKTIHRYAKAINRQARFTLSETNPPEQASNAKDSL